MASENAGRGSSVRSIPVPLQVERLRECAELQVWNIASFDIKSLDVKPSRRVLLAGVMAIRTVL